MGWFIGAAAAALIYVFVARPLLRRIPVLASLYARLDLIEAALWARSRTILVSRLYVVGGLIVGVHDSVAAIPGLDWSPILARLFADIPTDLRPMVLGLVVAVTGGIFEWLRRVTVAPLAEPPAPPAVDMKG